MGLEPTTPGLGSRYSTIELCPLTGPLDSNTFPRQVKVGFRWDQVFARIVYWPIWREDLVPSGGALTGQAPGPYNPVENASPGRDAMTDESTNRGSDRSTASGVTRIGSTTVLNGDIEAHEDVLVEGKVQGKISLPSGTLTVAKGARVEAEVRVRALILHGELKGTVRAAEKTVISETAVMSGDVITPKITIANGARFSGGIRMKE
jgi:cytoskeletal protein CcmA (bactofilin family)